MKRALISVSDKQGLLEFARQLQQLQIEILSTGGTASYLRSQQIAVTEVSDYTGFPEMMAGRVKTLHPKIHGGLLGRRGIDDEAMKTEQIKPIDLLVVNLYPFQQTTADPNCDLATAIENIDIGGPAMLRAAAKNYQAVTVIVDPADYPLILKELQQQQTTTLTTRFALAQKAFAHTAQYDGTIADYLSRYTSERERNQFPIYFQPQFIKKQDLRYGENPHQVAAFYVEKNPASGTIAAATLLQGKELSFNNINDADTALECVKSFTKPACVIVKHANPCGVAIANNLLDAYQRAYATDSTSAFGGIIAFNQTFTADMANVILNQQFIEVIVAPHITPKALAIFAQKPNVRILSCGKINEASSTYYDFKRIHNGLLVQTADQATISINDLKIVTKKQPSASQLNDLLFAWQVVKFVKSNAIVYAKEEASVGIGAGQMSRVISAKIAALKAIDANLSIQGAVMASDAFFPFRDSVDQAAKDGIAAIIQPGGSLRDNEVIAAADEANIAMVFTGVRHFRH